VSPRTLLLTLALAAAAAQAQSADAGTPPDAGSAPDAGDGPSPQQEWLVRTFVKEERYVVATEPLECVPPKASPFGTLELLRCDRDKLGDVTFTGRFTNTLAVTLTEVSIACAVMDAKGKKVLAAKPYLHRDSADTTVPAGATRDFSADASRDAAKRGTACRCALLDAR